MLSPSGNQIALNDPPPPPPELDPREPSPTLASTRRGRQTPQKARTPTGSRTASPSRPSNQPHSNSADGVLTSPRSNTLSPPSSQSPMPIQPIPYPAAQTAGYHISRPNSPSNSINSSSSAIFERDIELLPVGALSLNTNPPTQTLNHKSSRLSHGSTLEQTVPAVLDDAVEALQGTYSSRDMNGLEIEAPSSGVGMARTGSASLANIGSRKASTTAPLSSSTPRSSSPISVGSGKHSPAISPAQSPPILAQLQNHPPSHLGSISPPSSTGISPPTGGLARPGVMGRTSTGPQVPGGWSSSFQPVDTVSVAPSGSPLEEVPSPVPTPPAAIPSHLTPSKDKRRISFISYNDLLLSVPTTVTNLGEITSGNLSPEHLPGTVSPSLSTLSPVMPPTFAHSPMAPASTASPISPDNSGTVASGLASQHKSSWDANAAAGQRGGLGFEGEWQREGLGKGLEQRLEDLVQSRQ